CVRDELEEGMDQTLRVAENEVNHRELVDAVSLSLSAPQSVGERVGVRWGCCRILNFVFTPHPGPLPFEGRGRTSRHWFGQRCLARLNIPVAILAPEEAVERGGHFAEF